MDAPRKGLIAEVMGAWVIVCTLNLVHLKITDIGLAVEAKTHEPLSDERGVAVSRLGAWRRFAFWRLECLATAHAADTDIEGAWVSVIARDRVAHARLALSGAAAEQAWVFWDRALGVCDARLTAVRDEVVGTSLGRSAVVDGAWIAVIALCRLEGALTRRAHPGDAG